MTRGRRSPRRSAGWRDRRVSSSPRKRRIQEMPSPRTMWSASTMSFDLREWPPRARPRRSWNRAKAGGPCGTFPHLADVHDDGGDADDVVLVARSVRFANASRVGKSSTVDGRRDVLLDHHDAPRAMEHAQRKAPLGAGHLVVVQLHRVDRAAAELVVLRIRPKNGGQQNTGACALRVRTHGLKLPAWILCPGRSLARNITVIPTCSVSAFL